MWDAVCVVSMKGTERGARRKAASVEQWLGSGRFDYCKSGNRGGSPG